MRTQGFQFAMGIVQASIATLYFYFTARCIEWACWVLRDPDWELFNADTYKEYWELWRQLKRHTDNETKFITVLRSLQSMQPYKVLSNYHCVCLEESVRTKRSRDLIVAALEDRKRPLGYGQGLKLGLWFLAHWGVWSVVTLLTGELFSYMYTI